MPPAEDTIHRILEWDSDFFGFRIARATPKHLTRATAERLVAECHAFSVRCMYFLASPNDRLTLALLEEYKFGLKDIRLTMLHKSPARSVTANEVRVRPVQTKDIPILRQIARTSHRNTRFYADPNFPSHRCDDLYDVWIAKSCESGEADAVLVAEVDGRPVGYITCTMIAPLRGQIGLFAVASEARGAGIGAVLISQAIAWFQMRGAADIITVTQGGNVRAVQVYEHAGFVTEAVQLWYHRWFDAE